MDTSILSTIKNPNEKKDTGMTYEQVRSLLGYKFYKFENGKYNIIRIVNVKNKDVVKIIHEDDYIHTETMNPNDIINNYTKLISDGLMTFNIVKLFINKEKEGISEDDVIVCLYKNSTMRDNIQEPDVVCRQNITDLYYNYQRQNEETEMVGMCMTHATCPANLDYMIMTACDGVEYSIGVNVYIEDNIETILSMIPTKRFDKVLENGLYRHLKSFNILDNGTIMSHNGYCRNLKQLLIENNFQYDYDTVYNITSLNIDMYDNMNTVKDETSIEYYTLKNDITNQLNNLFKINISNTIIIEYDHDIDLLELEGSKYFIIRDMNNKLFIVNYTEDGEYRETDLAVISAKEALARIPIMFNRDKYK